jgi:MFS superfamily sulfate permease-like transporter
VFLLLLCNDKEVLGPWVNRPWLNVLSTVIISVLLMMSLVLMATTLFSRINVNLLAIVLGCVLVVAFAVGGIFMIRARSKRTPTPPMSKQHRANWRMPPLNLLDRPKWSRGRLIGMYLLRAYLVVAVLMLLVKAIELGVNK